MSKIVHQSEAVDIGSGDHVFVLKVSAIRCDGAGVVVARLRGDSTDSTWTVTAGEYLLGDFTTVRQTGTTATGMRGVSDR